MAHHGGAIGRAEIEWMNTDDLPCPKAPTRKAQAREGSGLYRPVGASLFLQPLGEFGGEGRCPARWIKPSAIRAAPPAKRACQRLATAA